MSQEDQNTKSNDALGDLDDKAVNDFWLGAITDAERYFEPWLYESERIYERYRDVRFAQHGGARTAQTSNTSREAEFKKFNIMWSNVQTIKPAIYRGPAEPVVGRRYKDSDTIARLAVEIQERTLAYTVDMPEEDYSYDAAMSKSVDDRLLSGRGVVWWKYEAEFATVEAEMGYGADGEEIEVAEAYEEKVSERACPFFVEYKDFMQQPNRVWEQLLRDGWLSFRTLMTRNQLVERFGAEKGNAVNLTVSSRPINEGETDRGRSIGGSESGGDLAEVWEIWNRPDRKVYWISKGYKDGTLDTQDDPLDLVNFFPCAKPLYATMTPGSPIPVPDYRMYKDQAENLDHITQRKWLLTTALAVRGIYAADNAEELNRLFDGSTRNKMVPVKDWQAIQSKGGLTGAIEWVPLDMVIQALIGLQQQEDATKQQIYEITGIADIVRGQSAAQETLGAQRMKGQWASLRISDDQEEVARFQRDNLRIAADIMAGHFDTKTYAEMSNFANTDMAQEPRFWEIFEQAVQLLRDDKARGFRVDVETEETLFADQQEEKQQRIELTTAVAGYMERMVQIAQTVPELLPLGAQVMSHAMKAFEGGRDLEFAVDQAVMALQDRAKRMQEAPQKPDPVEVAAQMEGQRLQIDQQKAETDRLKVVGGLQMDQRKLDLQAEQQTQDARDDIRDTAVALRGQNMQYQDAEKQRLADVMRGSM